MSDEDILEEYSSEAMRVVARALAHAFLHGHDEPGVAHDAEALRERGARALGRKWPWLKRLAREALLEFNGRLQPSDHDRLIQWILDFPAFISAFESWQSAPRVRTYFPFHPVMGRATAPLQGLAIPVLHTLGDVAAWLKIQAGELDWFADIAGWGSRSLAPKLLHYDCHWQPKASGGSRLIESPKSRLLALQRQILHDLLDRIPVHDAAHGCVRGRSALSNAQAHPPATIVMRLDLSDFFTSIRASRIHALFRSLGYTAVVARHLTGLTTHCTSPAVVRAMPAPDNESIEARRARKLRAKKCLARHLPQGAPTSPALANLCAYRLDLRLAGAAAESGAHYTRYVDDLVFSCESASRAQAQRIAAMAYTIILEEGFEPNVRKTRIMSRSQAQRVTGLVVNDKPNVPRADHDRLKAILTNCVRHGPSSQNREDHADFRAQLLGRIAWVGQSNAARGVRLRTLFERIQWDDLSQTVNAAA